MCPLYRIAELSLAYLCTSTVGQIGWQFVPYIEVEKPESIVALATARALPVVAPISRRKDFQQLALAFRCWCISQGGMVRSLSRSVLPRKYLTQTLVEGAAVIAERTPFMCLSVVLQCASVLQLAHAGGIDVPL